MRESWAAHGLQLSRRGWVGLGQPPLAEDLLASVHPTGLRRKHLRGTLRAPQAEVGWVGLGGERRSGIGEEGGSAEELLSATLSLHCPWFLGIMVGAGEAGAP